MPNKTLFHKLYLASRTSMSRLVSRIVPPHEIEDIVQETYVRICQIENFDKISSPKSFMFKVAKNLALDYQKKAGVKFVDNIDDEKYIEYLLSSDSDELFEKTKIDNEFSHFCEAVRLLPLQCRKVFVLKKVYGYSQREIAAQLSLSESTVEKHIATGMKRCTLFMRNINNAVTTLVPSSSSNSAGGVHE